MEMVINVVKPKKMRALLELRRALIEERYEDCSTWISLAGEYEARNGEISRILSNPMLHLEQN